jgi:hypothetical protein
MPRVGEFCPSNIVRFLLGVVIIVALLTAIGFWLYQEPSVWPRDVDRATHSRPRPCQMMARGTVAIGCACAIRIWTKSWPRRTADHAVWPDRYSTPDHRNPARADPIQVLERPQARGRARPCNRHRSYCKFAARDPTVTPGCTSSNPSPERIDEAFREESPLEEHSGPCAMSCGSWLTEGVIAVTVMARIWSDAGRAG